MISASSFITNDRALLVQKAVQLVKFQENPAEIEMQENMSRKHRESGCRETADTAHLVENSMEQVRTGIYLLAIVFINVQL